MADDGAATLDPDGRGGPLAAIRRALAPRPWWMNLMWGFCLYMTFVYLPFDIFIKPVAGDQEVWFGFVLHGWAAKLTAPLHWAIYAAGAWGFWRMRPWMWPWAAVYATQVALAMAVWNLVDPRGGGIVAAAIAGGVFAIPAAALWLARRRFRGAAAAPSTV